MKPDYDNPAISSSDNSPLSIDKAMIQKIMLKSLQKQLDEKLKNWTLVYHDEFTNGVIVTNGGSDVSELGYKITLVIQKTILELFKP